MIEQFSVVTDPDTSTHAVQALTTLDPFLSARHPAHPLDRKAESRSLFLDPLPCVIGRRAELCGRCSTCRAITDKRGDKFVGAMWLDPSEEFAARSHGARNPRLTWRADIDLFRSCLGDDITLKHYRPRP